MSLWVVSYAVLWIVVAILVVTNIAMFRQLGLLHLRFGPRGAFGSDQGPALSDSAPAFEAKDLAGQVHALGDGSPETTLVFVAPQCEVCEDLIPAIRALNRTLPRPGRLLVISSSDGDSTRSFARRVDPVPVIADARISSSYGVTSTPFAVHVAGGGIVVQKGVVNTLEQLEGIADAGAVQLDFGADPFNDQPSRTEGVEARG